MGELPQLIEEDMTALDALMAEFLAKTEAHAVLLTAQGGFIISTHGGTEGLDTMSLAALASNCFEANRAIAGLIGEQNFQTIYQAGESSSMFVQNIDGFNLMIILFPAQVAVGLVKHYSRSAGGAIAQVFEQAHRRTPGVILDLAMLNLPDSSELFRRKAS